MKNSWKSIKIADGFDFTSKPRHSQTDDELPFVPMDLVPIGVSHSSNYYVKKKSEIKSGVYFENGDLLLSRITPCFENKKQTVIDITPHQSGITSTEVIPIKPKSEEFSHEFLYYWLLSESNRNVLIGKMEGSTGRQRLSKGSLGDQIIVIPNRITQDKIVSLLRQIETKLIVIGTQIDKYSNLKSSIMEKLFHEGVNEEKQKESSVGLIPLSWSVELVADLLQEKPKNGVFIGRPDTTPRSKSGIFYLNVQDMYKNSVIATDRLPQLDIEVDEKSLLKNGDLLFVRSSLKREGIGWCCLVQGVKENNLTYDCHLIRIRFNSRVNPLYAAYYFLSRSGRQQIIANSKTTTMTTVNQDGIMSLNLPVPSLDEQKEISSNLRCIDYKLDSLEKKKTLHQSVFDFLLSQLLAQQIDIENIDFNYAENT